MGNSTPVQADTSSMTTNECLHQDSALLTAVLNQDLMQIKIILRNMSQNDEPAKSGVLDRAFMNLFCQDKDTALEILELLLKLGLEQVPQSIIYNTVSLLTLVDPKTLERMTKIICESTTSYILKGGLLQALVHYRQSPLVTMLVESGLDLHTFWDNQFDMRDLLMCAPGLDHYTRERLLPPDMAAIFIKATNNDSVREQIFKDMLSYTSANDAEVHKLVVLLIIGGYKLNAEQLKKLGTKLPSTAQWYSQHTSRSHSKQLQPRYKTDNKNQTNLNISQDMKNLPEQLRSLIMMDV